MLMTYKKRKHTKMEDQHIYISVFIFLDSITNSNTCKSFPSWLLFIYHCVFFFIQLCENPFHSIFLFQVKEFEEICINLINQTIKCRVIV